jgi:SAM-dependent methyltransferase
MVKLHPVTWTPAAIERFWNSYESTDGMDLWHFSRQRGAALISFVEKKIDIMEPVLDLGSGSGHLVQLLLDKNIPSFVTDVSSKGLELAEKRLSSQAGFLGARIMEANDELPFEDSSVGTVFLLETVEHLLPDTLTAVFTEIPRVLSKNGYLIITTPWREDLTAGSVTCGLCGCIFHKTQHLRANDEASVAALVTGAGFNIVSCKAELLLPDVKVWIKAQMTPARRSINCPECAAPCKSPNRTVFTRWKSLVHELKHLVCIAQKK